MFCNKTLYKKINFRSSLFLSACLSVQTLTKFLAIMCNNFGQEREFHFLSLRILRSLESDVKFYSGDNVNHIHNEQKHKPRKASRKEISQKSDFSLVKKTRVNVENNFYNEKSPKIGHSQILCKLYDSLNINKR
jgi:hypothetical protein